jgi:hypothetical protein
MHNVLFIYSKINYDVSYKQGMNEILAMLILAIYPYYHRTKPKYEIIISKLMDKGASTRDIYYYLFDEDEFEADIFTLFTSLMQRSLRDMYHTPDDVSKNNTPLFMKRELFHSKWEDMDRFIDFEKVEKLQIQQKCDKIFKKLEKVDKDLYKYLENLEIDTFIIFS